jgi:hypothetical protein
MIPSIGKREKSGDIKSDDLVKSLKRRISVIPAKAGIQLFQILKNSLDSGFHRSDDFLRDHQISLFYKAILAGHNGMDAYERLSSASPL